MRQPQIFSHQPATAPTGPLHLPPLQLPLVTLLLLTRLL